MKYCKCTVGCKEPDPLPRPRLFLPICSLWHKVGLIQITLLLLGSLLSIMHVCLQCSPKHPGKRSKVDFMWKIFYTVFMQSFYFIRRDILYFCCAASERFTPHQRHLPACKCSCEHLKDVKLHTLFGVAQFRRQRFTKKDRISEKCMQTLCK